jgi:IS30 family transposase
MDKPTPTTPKLTYRTWQVLTAWLAENATTKQIAADLFLSHHTVRTHIRRAYLAIGARNREHAAAQYHRLGLHEPPARPRTQAVDDTNIHATVDATARIARNLLRPGRP